MHITYLNYLITNMITFCTLILGLTVSNSICQEKLYAESFFFSKITYILSCVPLSQVSIDGCVSLGVTDFAMETTSSCGSPLF